MQILIVNFNLDGLSEEAFESSCDELAPAFAAVSGLASKVWLADRADLLRKVWGTSYDGGSNTVDVVIRSLRRKLGAIADRIETVRGVGYRLK